MPGKKVDKHCEGCRLDDGARFRTLASLYLCPECYRIWMKTGKVPEPMVDLEPEAEERRW